jgi:hypothetical protein
MEDKIAKVESGDRLEELKKGLQRQFQAQLYGRNNQSDFICIGWSTG